MTLVTFEMVEMRALAHAEGMLAAGELELTEEETTILRIGILVGITTASELLGQLLDSS